MSNEPPFVNMSELKIVEIAGIRVNEFHPLPNGQGDPTEVHLMLQLRGVDPRQRLALRMKSRRVVDELIAALETHRDNVWPTS
jgi:hypothetical protein